MPANRHRPRRPAAAPPMPCRAVLTVLLALTLGPSLARAQPDPARWDAVEREARGQTVYWHAWGGSTRTNDFIAWTGREVTRRFGVRLEHVKLSDTAEAVSRILAERAAGRDRDGAVDLIWINGENFAALKTAGLLFGPWVEDLPAWHHVDQTIPAVTRDFTIPTEGLEAPWGLAQVVIYYDSARVTRPPRTMEALLAWAERHPGRFTFPQPPNFLGSTVLKQVLYELTPDPARLIHPVDPTTYAAATAPVWAFLDRLTPLLWRGGAAFPQSGPRQIQLMADGEIDLAFSFSPNEAASAIANFELPETVRATTPSRGSIANANFVAIPYNARAAAGAMVVTNFLLSPEAQARKADPAVWGDATVLAVDRLPAADRTRFVSIDPVPGQVPAGELGRTLPEPHPSWMTRLEAEWVTRFGAGR